MSNFWLWWFNLFPGPSSDCGVLKHSSVGFWIVLHIGLSESYVCFWSLTSACCWVPWVHGGMRIKNLLWFSEQWFLPAPTKTIAFIYHGLFVYPSLVFKTDCWNGISSYSAQELFEWLQAENHKAWPTPNSEKQGHHEASNGSQDDFKIWTTSSVACCEKPILFLQCNLRVSGYFNLEYIKAVDAVPITIFTFNTYNHNYVPLCQCACSGLALRECGTVPPILALLQMQLPRNTFLLWSSPQ